MSRLDWGVLGAYLAGMILLSLRLSKGQSDSDDYYVGGRELPWWAVGISVMATQSSANSFVGIPSFVALAAGGGLVWLQYELAVPLAMIAIAVLLLPLFRELSLVSVYEYLELRFDRTTRLVCSGVFLLSRGLAVGVAVYASAIVLSVCLALPVWACVLIVSSVTVVYDTLGGMKAVVWSDVIQMVVLLGGLAACLWIAFGDAGGLGAATQAVDPSRLESTRWGWGIGDGVKAPFWGFLIGGLFLYMSYYGTDQSQVQRALSADSVTATRRALLFNGLARFPLTIAYALLGIALGAVYVKSEALRAAIGTGSYDELVPRFVLMRLPSGARGLVFAAVLAAAMSSLDSVLNSLSASTLRDFVEPALQRRNGSSRGESTLRPAVMLRWSKVITVLWGVAIAAFAFLVGSISSTVVEGINKIGSVFYGPILAAFLSGVVDRRAVGPAVIGGMLAGVGSNLVLWLGYGSDVYWMWWNVTGLLVAAAVTFTLSRALPPPHPDQLRATTLTWSSIRNRESKHLRSHIQLIGYFAVILVTSLFFRDILLFFAGIT